MQYLERGVQVRANTKITLLARREADRVRFSLKEGVGAFVGKPPWKIEWGGGASVESPHFQRVHYCELLVGDYLMRLKSRRFPPIEKEMRMILAHCGNLFLDPEVIAEITHWFACLELVHGQQDFSRARPSRPCPRRAATGLKTKAEIRARARLPIATFVLILSWLP